jgi:aromatic-L-amino-acid decarboxylase
MTTFRYVPPGQNEGREKLNELNTALLARLIKGGEAFVSNAIVDENYLLRACFVNFRTTESDVDRLVEIVVRIGREVSE